MSKRFTDTEKWKKAWFRKLPQKEKLFWFYILDNCNHAGIWDVDLDAASFYIGSKVDISIIQGSLMGHISPLKDNADKWYILDFVAFQYPSLDKPNRVHTSVINLLKKYNLDDPSKGLASPMQGRKDMVKDKDKVKEKDKEYTEEFNLFWDSYPKRQGKLKAFQVWNHAVRLVDASVIIEAAKAYMDDCKKNDTEQRFIKHATTWLNGCHWEDEYKTTIRKPAKPDFTRYEEEIKAQIDSFKRLRDYAGAVLDKYSDISGFDSSEVAIRHWRKTYGAKNER